MIIDETAVLQMGDATLHKMAPKLVVSIHQIAAIGRSLKESVRAAMRAKVRRLLAKYGYSLDLEEKAVELRKQAALFARESS